jgi:hypothetical protein
MPRAEMIAGSDPLPRYVMPDGSGPDYDRILDELHLYGTSLIGSSYYYVRSGSGSLPISLCRIVPGGGKIYFHEIVDNRQYGITDEDLEAAVRQNTGNFVLPGHFAISPSIEARLRTFLDPK